MGNIEKEPGLLVAIKEIVTQARARALKSNNSILLQMYWQIGQLIVEDEQQGKSKAVYGRAVLKQLSQQLTLEFRRALMKVISAISVSFTWLFQFVTQCVTN